MRKFKGAFISILVLLILVGGYFLISNIQPDNDKETSKNEDSNPFGDVFTVNFEDIISFGVQNSHGSYSLELKDGLWSCTEDKSVRLNQDTVFAKVVSASYYDAYTIKEGEYDPYEYGFDNPSMIISLGLKNGDNHTVTFGSIAPTDDYLYYITVDDKPAVYAVLGAKYDTLNVPLGSFRDTEFFTLDYTGIRKITISGRDKETIVIEENTGHHNLSLSNWIMTSPYYKSVNEFTLSDLIIAPLSENTIQIVSYVEDNPVSLSKYGLDNPANAITFTYDDRTVSLKFGDFAPDGNVYAMRSDTQTVYTVSYSYFTFFEYTAFEFVDKSVYFAVITDLSSLNVKAGKDEYEISIPVKGTDYRVNGKKTSEDKVKRAYSELAALSIGGIVTQPVSASPEVTLTYNYIDGNKAVIEFIPYTARNYAIKINGSKADFYVKKADVSNLISRIAEL